jgi:predicted rRNA methylase YqxC with S4 and FtsJ domains
MRENLQVNQLEIRPNEEYNWNNFTAFDIKRNVISTGISFRFQILIITAIQNVDEVYATVLLSMEVDFESKEHSKILKMK